MIDASPLRRDVRPAILAHLAETQWVYDEEADEMELLLPGSEGREGRAVLIEGELYLRLDPGTGQPLSLLIPAWTDWLARHRSRAPTARSEPPEGIRGAADEGQPAAAAASSREADHPAAEAVQRAVACSADLAGIGVR